jgi:hypothetical protein
MTWTLLRGGRRFKPSRVAWVVSLGSRTSGGVLAPPEERGSLRREPPREFGRPHAPHAGHHGSAVAPLAFF